MNVAGKTEIIVFALSSLFVLAIALEEFVSTRDFKNECDAHNGVVVRYTCIKRDAVVNLGGGDE